MKTFSVVVQSQTGLDPDEPGSLSPSAHQTHWCALAVDVSSQKLRGHADASAAEVPVAHTVMRHTPALVSQNLPARQVQPLADDVAPMAVHSLAWTGQVKAAYCAVKAAVPGFPWGVMQQHKRS